jgi:hypothetical protein
LVVWAVQVLIDDLIVLLLSAEHDAVELHVSAIVLGILEPICLCVFLQAHFAQLEEHTVHELHPSLKLRECLVEQITVFLLKYTHSHDRGRNQVHDGAVVEVVRGEVHLKIGAHSFVVLPDLFTFTEIIAEVKAEVAALSKHTQQLVI